MSTGRRASRRITLADVAKEAGVSVQTASHVLAGNLTVRLPESTRKKVAEAAERVGYRPNRLAQAMKRGRTKMIAVWVPLERPNLTYLWFLQAIDAKAKASGYDILITGIEGTLAYGAQGKTPYVWPVDGLIAVDAGKAVRVFREDARNDSIPVAIFGLELFDNTDSVSWDLMKAAREVTERLIAKGCRRIVHVTLDWILNDYPREQRRRGYSEAMEAAGLTPEFVSVTGESSSASEDAVTAYLKDHSVPDAIFGATDALAIGSTRAVMAKGGSVPQDCKVWGFGDLPEGKDFRVPLSTIRIPISAVVEQAWDWLIERVDAPETEGRRALLEMELVERESSR